ncbi:MAG: hypothetical protein QXZ51_00235 [Candidatus Bathyarchaeia archaeon]
MTIFEELADSEVMLGDGLDEFDKTLLEVIDETLRYSLGKKTVEIFYDYLKRRGFSLTSIPQNLEFFFNELRSVLEFDGQRFHTVSPLGIVSLLERTIIEILCKKFGVKFEEKGPIIFSEWVDKLREVYLFKTLKSKALDKRR